MSDVRIGSRDGLDYQPLTKQWLARIDHLRPCASIVWVVEVGIKK